MIITSSKTATVITSGMTNAKIKDSKIPTIPISFTAVVSSLKRVFAWVCG